MEKKIGYVDKNVSDLVITSVVKNKIPDTSGLVINEDKVLTKKIIKIRFLPGIQKRYIVYTSKLFH